MALIPVHHTLCPSHPVSPDTNPEIVQGMVVSFNSSGYVVKADTSSLPIGIAADSSENSTGHTPYQADLVVNGAGATLSTQNRVSDFFNETLASSKISVYQGSGVFETDQYEANTFTPGEVLYASANAKLTDTDAGSQTSVGFVNIANRAYPSGVPGTDTPDGSMSIGSYLQFTLAIGV